MAMETYFFDQQLAKYIVQFMAVFKGLKYHTGTRADGNIRVLDVPVIYGSRDRVVASILADNTQNAMIELPTMSAYMSGIELAPDRRKGVGTTRRVSHMPLGGLFPNDVTVVHQVMPIPYDMTMELTLYVSNSHQHRQILEQILMYFDPMIQIQKTDGVFDWTKITQVELTNIALEENYPAGIDKRAIVSTFTFTVPIYISAPADLRNQWVKDIYLRISMAETSDDLNEVLASMDGNVMSPILLSSANSTVTQIGESCPTDPQPVDVTPDANC